MKMMKKVVTGVFIYWIVFVATMTIIFCFKSAVPDTLIQYGLGGGAVELLATTLIEIFKKKFEVNATEKENADGCDTDNTNGDTTDSGDSGRGTYPVDKE